MSIRSSTDTNDTAESRFQFVNTIAIGDGITSVTGNGRYAAEVIDVIANNLTESDKIELKLIADSTATFSLDGYAVNIHEICRYKGWQTPNRQAGLSQLLDESHFMDYRKSSGITAVQTSSNRLDRGGRYDNY